MILMRSEEGRDYTRSLAPYLSISLVIFATGIVIGLMFVARFPALTDYFQETITAFVSAFAEMSRVKLAGAIFLNNAVKTLLSIVLGSLLGIVPFVFLFINGIALGVAGSLSFYARGLWISVLSLLPHGVLELPAVFLGTSIGLRIGLQGLCRLFGKSRVSVGAELVQGLRYYATVIVPLLIAAALVEAFVTSALIMPR